MARVKSLAGLRYGKLLVLEMLPRECDENGKLIGEPVWHCICDCGNTEDVAARILRTGKHRSCGCMTNSKQRRFNPCANVKDEDVENMVMDSMPAIICPYPYSGCKVSKAGTCCRNCAEFEECPNACKNKPLPFPNGCLKEKEKKKREPGAGFKELKKYCTDPYLWADDW